MEKAQTKEELKILWERNWAVVRMLKENFPNLMSDRHKHYTDYLILLYRGRLKDFEEVKPNGEAQAPKDHQEDTRDFVFWKNGHPLLPKRNPHALQHDSW